MNQEEEDNNIAEEPFKKEKEIANLWANTLREHGRDYDNSKEEINNFFLTLIGHKKRDSRDRYK